jgi:hypothetical protein
MDDSVPTNFKNKTLTCQDCSMPFIWTAGEQFYYAHRNLSQPKRCPDCRQKRRNAIAPAEEVQ